jgi:hypothetical protein
LKSSTSDFFKYNVAKYQKLETIKITDSNEIIYLTIWNDESSASAAKFEVLFYPAPEIIVDNRKPISPMNTIVPQVPSIDIDVDQRIPVPS